MKRLLFPWNIEGKKLFARPPHYNGLVPYETLFQVIRDDIPQLVVGTVPLRTGAAGKVFLSPSIEVCFLL